MEPGMNDLLKWGIENSRPADPNSSNDAHSSQTSTRHLNEHALRTLMGGPSDAELMVQSMTAIASPDISVEDKVTAFDNFEQLVENIDNANNMESLKLWSPLARQLHNEEPELRRYAAWCMGTAVQNNIKSQERLLAIDAIPILVKLAIEDTVENVRRKAIYALSSEVRNYQPALDEVVKALPKHMAPEGEIDAADMDAVDRVINALRNDSASRA